MRAMSFAKTTSQVRDRTKTVTRRLGWQVLKPGDRVRAVEKVMGLRKGEKRVELAVIEVVSVRRERLDAITDEDVGREGFPGRDAGWFVRFFSEAMAVPPWAEVTRIEFRYVDREAP